MLARGLPALVAPRFCTASATAVAAPGRAPARVLAAARAVLLPTRGDARARASQPRSPPLLTLPPDARAVLPPARAVLPLDRRYYRATAAGPPLERLII